MNPRVVTLYGDLTTTPTEASSKLVNSSVSKGLSVSSSVSDSSSTQSQSLKEDKQHRGEDRRKAYKYPVVSVNL